jgi:hypothetical protein
VKNKLGFGDDSSSSSSSTGAGPRANSSDPRGIRNNNPLNLEYRPDQGAIGSDGRFGVFPTMEAGVAAAARQLKMYRDQHGLNTVSGIVGRWAPAGENNTNAYILSVAKAMGVDPNAQLDLDNPAVMSSLISAMARVENGRRIDGAAVQRGVGGVSQAGPRLNSGNTALLPPAGSRGESTGNTSTQSSSTSLDIGQITIHTAATDAHSIAKEIHGAISDHMIAQSNTGLT